MSGEFARTLGYQSLMVGNPLLDRQRQPIITLNEDGELMIARRGSAGDPGSARGSRLIERMFEQPLRRTRAVHPARLLPPAAPPASTPASSRTMRRF